MTSLVIVPATAQDADDLLSVQLAAFKAQADLYDDSTIPPMVETREQVVAATRTQCVLKAVAECRIVGTVRVRLEGTTAHVSRLAVHPSHQRRGIGMALMRAAETALPGALRMELFTGEKSARNIALYRKLGYRTFRGGMENDHIRLLFMAKTL